MHRINRLLAALAPHMATRACDIEALSARRPCLRTEKVGGRKAKAKSRSISTRHSPMFT
jgi:hypothetical protein